MSFSLLLLFRFFSLSLEFSSLIMMLIGVVFFVTSLLVVP